MAPDNETQFIIRLLRYAQKEMNQFNLIIIILRSDIPSEIRQALHLQQSGLVQGTGVDVDAVAVDC